MLAAHLLHSVSQLDDAENRATLAQATHVAVSPTFPLDKAVEAAPQALFLVSFNAKALYFGDKGRNPWWNGVRSRLLERKREDGSHAFLYADQSKDPGDPTPHLGLIEPTLENAEAWAKEITDRLIALRDGWPGSCVEAYIDDAPRVLPRRLERGGDIHQQGRWEGYLSCLLTNLPGLPYVNCGGDPPAPYVTPTCEAPRTNPQQMANLMLGRFFGEGGDPGSVYHGILWGSEVGVPGLFMPGRYLR